MSTAVRSVGAPLGCRGWSELALRVSKRRPRNRRQHARADVTQRLAPREAQQQRQYSKTCAITRQRRKGGGGLQRRCARCQSLKWGPSPLDGQKRTPRWATSVHHGQASLTWTYPSRGLGFMHARRGGCTRPTMAPSRRDAHAFQSCITPECSQIILGAPRSY
eukprot:354756-Chlamydomonas_euryale.AAC.6